MSSQANLRKYHVLITFCLLICAFIYIFYRVEGAAINIVVRYFLSDSFLAFKESVRQLLPLHEAIVYSLPGGLWVFCASLLSKNLQIRILKKSFKLDWFPAAFALWLECWQFFGVINGRFDWVDVLFIVIFAALARVLSATYEFPKQNILAPFNVRSLEFATVFFSVFMAHVF